MSAATRDLVWARLVAAGIAAGPVPADEGAPSPWYMRALLGGAAWLASLFLLVFVGLAFDAVVRDRVMAMLVGTVVCAVAVGALRLARDGVFVTQLAIAASLAGQALVTYGLLDSGWTAPGPWLGVAAFEVVLIAGAPNALHRVLSTLAVAAALRMALAAMGAAALFPPLVAAAFVATCGRGEGSRAAAVVAPVAAGLAVAVLLVVPSALLPDLGLDLRPGRALLPVPPWAGTLAMGAVFLWAIVRLLDVAQVPWNSRIGTAALAGGALVAAAAWSVPALVVALVVLLLAFATGRTALAGAAVVALLFALGHYYYSLQAPLLAKAAALAGTGVVLLGARVVVHALAARTGADPRA